MTRSQPGASAIVSKHAAASAAALSSNAGALCDSQDARHGRERQRRLSAINERDARAAHPLRRDDRLKLAPRCRPVRARRIAWMLEARKVRRRQGVIGADDPRAENREGGPEHDAAAAVDSCRGDPIAGPDVIENTASDPRGALCFSDVSRKAGSTMSMFRWPGLRTPPGTEFLQCSAAALSVRAACQQRVSNRAVLARHSRINHIQSSGD